MSDQFDPTQPDAESQPDAGHDEISGIGGVPVDGEIGSLPPVDGDSYVYYDESSDKPRKSKQAPKPPRRRSRGSGLPCMIIVGCLLVPCLCCMVCCVAITIAGGAAAYVYSNEVTESGSETVGLETDEVITLSVNNPSGKVRIKPGNDRQVVVEYTKYAYGVTDSHAQGNLDNIAVEVKRVGQDQVTVEVKKDGSFLDLGEVRLTISVPPEVNLVLESDAAALEVYDVTVHSLVMRADAGSITFDGEIAPDATAGDRFSIETDTGEIQVRLPRDVYVELDVHADIGEVTVSNQFSSVDGSERRDFTSESWTGTLGQGDGNAPRLSVKTNTGEIIVQPR